MSWVFLCVWERSFFYCCYNVNHLGPHTHPHSTSSCEIWAWGSKQTARNCPKACWTMKKKSRQNIENYQKIPVFFFQVHKCSNIKNFCHLLISKLDLMVWLYIYICCQSVESNSRITAVIRAGRHPTTW